MKLIFLLFILLHFSKARTIELSEKKSIDDKECIEMVVEVEMETTTINNEDETETSSYVEDVVDFSIFNAPRKCDPNEQIDAHERCREVQYK